MIYITCIICIIYSLNLIEININDINYIIYNYDINSIINSCDIRMAIPFPFLAMRPIADAINGAFNWRDFFSNLNEPIAINTLGCLRRGLEAYRNYVEINGIDSTDFADIIFSLANSYENVFMILIGYITLAVLNIPMEGVLFEWVDGVLTNTANYNRLLERLSNVINDHPDINEYRNLDGFQYDPRHSFETTDEFISDLEYMLDTTLERPSEQPQLEGDLRERARYLQDRIRRSLDSGNLRQSPNGFSAPWLVVSLIVVAGVFAGYFPPESLTILRRIVQ